MGNNALSLRTRVYAFLITVAIVGGGLYFFNQNYELDGWVLKARAEDQANKNAKKGEPAGDAPTPVEIEAAERGRISSFVSSTANLRALREVQLMPRIEGVVREVSAEEGDYVSEGELLCRLDDRELRINLELARQRLEQTKIQLESAKILRDKNLTQIEAKQRDLARNRKALEEGLVSDTDVILIENQLAELKHDERAQAAAVRENEYRVEELTAEIESVQVQISHTRITAPFNGRITERTVEVGQTVRPTDSLFGLASFVPLYADVFLSELESRRVRPGQDVEIGLGAEGSDTVTGRIVRVSPVVDDATGTVKVTAQIDRPGPNFRPGAFVRARIRTDTREETVLAPKRAVVEEAGRTYIFVQEGETAVKREVELGYEDGPRVEVVSGLSPGENVIVAGQGSLQDGDKTRVVS